MEMGKERLWTRPKTCNTLRCMQSRIVRGDKGDQETEDTKSFKVHDKSIKTKSVLTGEPEMNWEDWRRRTRQGAALAAGLVTLWACPCSFQAR